MDQSTSSSTNNDIKSFTTTEFIDKIKETIILARDILQNGNIQTNEKIQNLLQIQCANTLKILTNLNQNDLNPNSRDCNFTLAKFDDQQKIDKLIEIDDALIDKAIHYFECVRNLKDKKNSSKTNLIQVQMNLDNEKKQNSRIIIKDVDKNNFKRKFPYNDDVSDNDPQSKSKRNVLFMAATNVKRPQIAYKIKVDNSYSTPFVPKLTRKPNAIKSLEESIKQLPQTEQIPNLLPGYNYPKYYYPHPYQYEIENLVIPPEFFTKIDPEKLKMPTSLNDKRRKFITKRDELHEMIGELKKFKEIAVDLEHHSFRSYQGLTCLLQISTDEIDYIIDVFPLWNDMQSLNEIFTSPKILKVFHSSSFDIIWLQRDLGIYVVNMFDTWVAAKTLGYQHLSLSSLVENFCQFQMDKRFQLADWRIRPMTEEMLQYAQCDTHFLLYIYRRLKQELLNSGDQTGNLLRVVMERSQEICLKRYEKKLPQTNDHFPLIWKNNLKFNPKQMAALKSLYAWRDVIARQEDESTGYVLPNNLLLKICEILPREQQGILASCNPIPPLVRQYINEIHRIIFDARSKIVMDQQCSTFVASQEKNDINIDLTNDLLIDHPLNVNKMISIEHHDDHLAHHEHHDQPLLIWSEESQKFTAVNSQQQQLNGQINHSSTASNNKSLMNMFDVNNNKANLASNKSNKIKNDHMEKLFDGYITFYQRYLIKIKQKNEQS